MRPAFGGSRAVCVRLCESDCNVFVFLSESVNALNMCVCEREKEIVNECVCCCGGKKSR